MGEKGAGLFVRITLTKAADIPYYNYLATTALLLYLLTEMI